MRRIYSLEDDMRCLVTYEFDNGSRTQFDARDVQRYGLSEMLRRAGIAEPTERVPVFQHGKIIGTVPSYFDPLGIRPSTPLYEPRRGDFVRSEGGWNAESNLGCGDLDSIPEFRWKTADEETARAKRLEEDRAILRECLFAEDPPEEQGGR